MPLFAQKYQHIVFYGSCEAIDLNKILVNRYLLEIGSFATVHLLVSEQLDDYDLVIGNNHFGVSSELLVELVHNLFGLQVNFVKVSRRIKDTVSIE